MIREFDQTENTMPTLDYGKYFIGRFINPTIEYGIYSSKKNYPKTAAIIGKMIAPKIESKLIKVQFILPLGVKIDKQMIKVQLILPPGSKLT